MAIQVFGGMGYVEETGVAQHLRDARIAPIYEGTNGIQAMDLVARKLRQSNGAAYRRLFGEMAQLADALPAVAAFATIRRELGAALSVLTEATAAMAAHGPRDAAAAASPYLRLFALTLGGWLLARQARHAAEAVARGDDDPAFLEAKIAAAHFFAEQILPQVGGLLAALRPGAGTLFAIGDEQLAQ